MIMNRKNTKAIVKSEQELEQQTNQTKMFRQDIFKVDYTNKSKIFYHQPPQSSDVKINNYLCYQEDNRLHKVTEIIYEDKLIRIQDYFVVNLDEDKVKKQESLVVKKKERANGKNPEKVRIFSKDALKNHKNSKTDKKNIVKNIVKIFLSWLQKKGNDYYCQEAYEQLKLLLNQQNFNNRLIKKMSTNTTINKVFLEFITTDAEQQIKFSRIQDKDSHYEALKLYTSLITQEKSILGNNSSYSIDSSSNQMEDEQGSPKSPKNITHKQEQKGQQSIITKQQFQGKAQ